MKEWLRPATAGGSRQSADRRTSSSPSQIGKRISTARAQSAREGRRTGRSEVGSGKGERLRILNLGVSHSPVCGVRDYAERLGEELASAGHAVESEWLERPASVQGTLDWIRTVTSAEMQDRVDVVLWHYSVFAYSSNGVPTVALPLSWALWRARVPVVGVLHEFVFPWGRHGWKGTAWAASQRLALPAVVAVSSRLLVTVEDRAAWLREQRWLPCRPTTVVPVFSCLPESLVPPIPQKSGPMRIGMLGYPKASARLITEAMEYVRATGISAELWLLGAPGQDTSAGEAWRRAGGAASIDEAMKFTGIVRPERLADEIAHCDILIFDDTFGPSSRKTTLAAILVSGRPVVAIDGPSTWSLLAEAGAVRLVARNPRALGEALLQLANDDAKREELGARSRAFYERHQSRRVVAAAVLQLIWECCNTLAGDAHEREISEIEGASHRGEVSRG